MTNRYECIGENGMATVYRVEKQGSKWTITDESVHYVVGRTKTKKDAITAMQSVYKEVRELA